MPTEYVDRPATAERLRLLAERGVLSAQAFERALDIAGHIPDTRKWRRFVSRGLLALSAALFLSGVIFFFAYNWAALHRLVKLGMIEAAIIGAVVAATLLDLRSLPGKLALLAAAVLIGALLAVLGQVYQTGADSFLLFAYWTVFVAGWVAVARFVPLWAGLLVLINLSVLFYLNQRHAMDAGTVSFTLFAVNATWLALWEWAEERSGDWMNERWLPRLAGTASVVYLLVPTIAFAFWGDSRPLAVSLAPLVFLVYGAWTVQRYYHARHDLLMLTVLAFSVVAILTAYLGRVLFFSDPGFFFLLGVVVIALTAGAFKTLLWVRDSWGESE